MTGLFEPNNNPVDQKTILMSTVRYYSDLISSHRNMGYERFKDEYAMNDHIIYEWNKVVGKGM
jgi:hypothetical protein